MEPDRVGSQAPPQVLGVSEWLQCCKYRKLEIVFQKAGASHFPDLHVSDLLTEVVTEDLVAVTQQIPRDTIERKGLPLLCRPFRRRLSVHIEVDHTASFRANTRNTYST
jgi:hypothetical protein